MRLKNYSNVFLGSIYSINLDVYAAAILYHLLFVICLEQEFQYKELYFYLHSCKIHSLQPMRFQIFKIKALKLIKMQLVCKSMSVFRSSNLISVINSCICLRPERSQTLLFPLWSAIMITQLRRKGQFSLLRHRIVILQVHFKTILYNQESPGVIKDYLKGKSSILQLGRA